MKREILFRGKTKDKKWVEGFYTKGYRYYEAKSLEDFIYTYTYKKNSYDYSYAIVQPETIGQFTGLTDKNGKKIFEGDIVKAIQTEYDEDKEQEPFIFEVIGEMIFEDACFGLKAKKCIDFYSPMWEEDNVDLEVIGNIHDNPELLGE